jgi:hypothetical protein
MYFPPFWPHFKLKVGVVNMQPNIVDCAPVDGFITISSKSARREMFHFFELNPTS